MIFEVICPDCRGRGHFSIVEGDIFKGYSICGNGRILRINLS